MIAPARTNIGMASSGNLVAPSYMTRATLGRMPEALGRDHRAHGDDRQRDRDRHVDQDQDAIKASSISQQDHGPSSAASPSCSRRPPRGRANSCSGRLTAWPRMNRTAPIGMTDWVNCTGTQGRLTRVSPSSTSSTTQPTQASRTKKAKPPPARRTRRAPSVAPAAGPSRPSKADVGALVGGQGGAVVGQPGELDRGDLVVPGERGPGLAARSRRRPPRRSAPPSEDHDGLEQPVGPLPWRRRALLRAARFA